MQHPQYLAHSGTTIIRPTPCTAPRVFTALGALFILAGLVPGVRFLYFYFAERNQAAGQHPSLILSAVLLIVGFQILLIGLLADLIGFNRKILEEVLYRMRRLELGEKGAQETEPAQPSMIHDP
jgi:hypothetical protein